MRAKKNSVSILFYLRLERVNKYGEHPINIHVIKDNITTKRCINATSKADHWNFKKNEPKVSNPNQAAITKAMNDLRYRIVNVAGELENNGFNYSSRDLLDKVYQKKETILFFDFVDMIISRNENANKFSNASKYEQMKHVLSAFCSNPNLRFHDINQKFLSDFEAYLYGRNNKDITIKFYMKNIRAAFNSAIKEEYCSIVLYPFKKFTLSKYNVKTRKRSLSQIELTKIEELCLKDSPALLEAKNVFLLTYYFRGMNIADISELKVEDVKSGKVHYCRKKTNDNIRPISITEKAADIIDYFKGNNSEYILPIFTKEHKTVLEKFERRKAYIKSLNTRLKEIQRLCEIDLKLTSYVSRHTYANMAFNASNNVYLVKEALGHKDIRTTEIYLESLDNSIIDDMDSKIFNTKL